MADPGSRLFDGASKEVSLSKAELWMRYFALGGNAMPAEFEAFLEGALRPTPGEHDVLAHALNERSIELGLRRRWQYSDET